VTCRKFEWMNSFLINDEMGKEPHLTGKMGDFRDDILTLCDEAIAVRHLQ